MATPNILMTRIDNRLVHGQVGVTWASTLGANLLLVANDDAANDLVQQNLMDMVVADGVQTRYFTLQKTINIIAKAASHQKIFFDELKRDQIAKQVIGLSGIKTDDANSYCIDLSLDDIWLIFPYLLFAQMLAFEKSLVVGLTPDNPCPTGEVNRVVKGVNIYPFISHKQ